MSPRQDVDLFADLRREEEYDLFADLRPSFGESMVGLGARAARGVLGSVAIVPEAIGILAQNKPLAGLSERVIPEHLRERMATPDPSIARGLRGAGAAVRAAGEAIQPEGAEGLAAGGLAETVGAGFGLIAMGAASGLIPGLAGLSATARIASLGSLAGGAEFYYDALAGGAEEGSPEAFKSMLIGMGVGTTEAVPLGRILSRVEKASGGGIRRALTRALIEGVEEAGQEAFQKTTSNLVATHLRDEDRSTLEGVFENAGTGAGAGVILSLFGSGLARVRTGPPAGQGPAAAASAGPSGPRATSEGPTEGDVPRGTTPEPRAPSEEAVAAATRVAPKGRIRPATTPTQGAVRDAFEAGGAEAVFVEGLGQSAAYTRQGGRGVALFDVALSEEDLGRRVAAHEFSHHLRATMQAELADVEGPGLGPWHELYRTIERVDPEGLGLARTAVEEGYGPVFEAQGLTGAARAAAVENEVLGNYLQDQGAFLFQGDRLAEVLRPRSVAVRVLDALVDLLNRIPLVSIEPGVQRRLRRLRDSLAETPLEGRTPPAVMAELSAAVDEAFGALQGYQAPQRAKAVSPSTPPGRPTSVAPASTAVAPTPAEAPVAQVARPAPPSAPAETTLTGPQAKRLRQKRGKLERRAREARQRGDLAEAERIEAELRGAAPPAGGAVRTEARPARARGGRPEVTRRREPSRAESAIAAYEEGEEISFARRRGEVEVSYALRRTPKALGQRYFTYRGDLPKSVFERKVVRDGWVNQHMQRVEDLVVDVQRAARDAFGGKPKGADWELLDLALKNPVTRNSLPQPLRDRVQALRDHIDELSMHLVREGIVSGDLAAKITANLDVYATRSYRAFDDPAWSKKVPVDVRNRAKAFLRSEHPNATDAQLEGMIDAILFEAYDSQTPMGLLARSKLGSKDLSIFKKRKDVPWELRELLGEYKDVRANYARSVAKMAFLIGNHRFLGEVRQDGLGVYLHDQPTKGFHAKIAADASSVMEPLNGLYTSEEILEAFRAFDGASPSPAWLQGWMWINGVAKYGKTVGSLMTQVRNFAGNVPFWMAQGYLFVPPTQQARSFGAGVSTVLTSFHRMNEQARRDYVRHLIELGVLHESARAGELFDVLSDVSMADIDALSAESLRGRVGRGLKLLTRLYQAGDDFWKAVAFENELYRHEGVFASHAELEAHAAQLVRNLFPTYSLVPQAIKALRRVPVIGTFVSFPWEVMRTSKNTILQIQKELGSSNPKLRKIGAARAVGAMMAAGWAYGLATLLRYVFDMTRDEEDAARELVPPWSENSDLGWFGWSDNGNRNYVDLSYTDPYSYLKQPIRAFLRGEDWQEKVVEAGKGLLEPFMGEELATQAAIDLMRNQKSTGGEVYNAEAAPVEQLGDAIDHIYKQLEPGTISSLRRVYYGTQGRVRRGGKVYDPKIESLSMVSGVRIEELDVPYSLGFKASDHKNSMATATSILTRVASNPGRVTDEELADAYDELETSRRSIFRRMQRVIHAARGLGIEDQEIRRSLRSGGLSERAAAELMRGRYTPYRPTGAFLSSYLRGADPQERRELLRRRAFVQQLFVKRSREWQTEQT